MKYYRRAGFLLGTTIFLLLGMGKAAWAVDYSGTLDFTNYSTTVQVTAGAITVPVDVGLDLDRYDLGSSLSGPVDISFTTHNPFNTSFTALALLFATNPNDAIVSDPTRLASLVDPSVSLSSLLDTHVPGWTFGVYKTAIVSNGTSNISGLFNPPNQFSLGTHYYAFIAGATTRSGTLLTDPSVAYTLSVGAVPEPEEYAMIIAGLGLIGAMRRRRKGIALA
jgi:hypothetical protein